MKSDSQLQHDVIAELEWEPSIDHADIGVAVIDDALSRSPLAEALFGGVTRRMLGNSKLPLVLGH